MRSFSEVLTESKKTYSFKVGIAGDIPEGFKEHLGTMLEKFSVVNLSSPKKTPIQERPLDFPHLENTDVHYFDVEVNYPTTPQILGEYISQCSSVHASHIMVRTPDDNLERYQNKEENTVYEPILTKEDLGGESAQNSVGDNRVMDLLKELEQARKEREHDPAAAAPKGDSKDISSSENIKSTIGS